MKSKLAHMESTESSEYRKNAELCEKQAQQAPTSHIAEEYQTLARQWREMAEQADRSGF